MTSPHLSRQRVTKIEQEIATKVQSLSGTELMEVAVGLLARAHIRTVEKEGRDVADTGISSVKSIVGGMWLDNLRASAKEGKPLV